MYAIAVLNSFIKDKNEPDIIENKYIFKNTDEVQMNIEPEKSIKNYLMNDSDIEDCILIQQDNKYKNIYNNKISLNINNNIYSDNNNQFEIIDNFDKSIKFIEKKNIIRNNYGISILYHFNNDIPIIIQKHVEDFKKNMINMYDMEVHEKNMYLFSYKERITFDIPKEISIKKILNDVNVLSIKYCNTINNISIVVIYKYYHKKKKVDVVAKYLINNEYYMVSIKSK